MPTGDTDVKTRVVHCEGDKTSNGNYVYIGRPGMWGNPFIVGRDGTREQVIKKFTEWMLASQDPRAVNMRLHIHTLKGKILGCWCKPQACHGDVLAHLADKPLTP